MRNIAIVIFSLLLFSCGPRDQESCITQAAREAKSVGAMQILAEGCKREFPARRRDDGTYTYYDNELGDWVGVSGPKISSEDIEKIKYFRKLKKDREHKSFTDKLNAMKNIKLLKHSIDCEDNLCLDKYISGQVFNGSDRDIWSVGISYDIGNDINCEGSLSNSFNEGVEIPPGKSGTFTHKLSHYGFAGENEAGPEGLTKGCVHISDVYLRP